MTDERDVLNTALGETGPVMAAGGDPGGVLTAAAEASSTVLDVGLWGKRAGKRLSELWDSVGIECNEDVAADAHGALFDPDPQLANNPSDKQRAEWFKTMMQSPEYRALHAVTMYDDVASDAAAAAVAKQWVEYAATVPEKQPDGGDGSSEPGGDDEPIGETMKRISSTAKAMQGAKEASQQARDAAQGLGGEGGGAVDRAAVAKSLARMRNDQRLAQIIAMAGRSISLASGLQRTKVKTNRGALSGIELSGDLSRLIPAELCQVAGGIPELQDLATMRLIQARCLSYRAESSERASRGPIVVLVDESGSMSGDKIAVAKGVALAMYWVARQQGRWCCLAGFSHGSHHHWLTLKPGESNVAGVSAWASHFYGGGTTLDALLTATPAAWPGMIADGMPRGKADVIVITDAEVEGGDVEGYKRFAKDNNVQTYGIVIGAAGLGTVGEVCDRAWRVEQLGLDSAAVAECLSI